MKNADTMTVGQGLVAKPDELALAWTQQDLENRIVFAADAT